MKYKIEVGYTTDLMYDNFDDFTAAIGVLLDGGVERLRMEVVKEKKDESDTGMGDNNSSMV